MRLEGKAAIITGSDQGIGRGIALRFASEGADVVINYRRNAEGAEQTRRDVEALGRRSSVMQADVSVIAEGRKLVEHAFSIFGDVQILVNNAGVEKQCDFWDVTEQEYDAVIAVNQTGPFFITQRFVQLLRERKSSGRVINISSVHEELPFPHFTSYCMSKGALKMMARNLAIELAPLGITVNNIAPGAIETPMNAKLLNDPVLLETLKKNIPLARLGKPEDVAAMAVFLASSDADYVTGTSFFVDGGLLWNYHEQ